MTPVEKFGRRVILECLQAASVTWWERRAGTFAAVGTPSCDEVAQACRNKARAIAEFGLTDFDAADLDDVLAEVA